MVKHLVLGALLALLALGACKRADEQPPTPSSTPGATRVDPPSTPGEQKGPGFHVTAKKAATTSQSKLADDQLTDDVYTFEKSGDDQYEVRIHEVLSSQGGLQAATLLRDKLMFTAVAKLHEEDLVVEGAKGFDLSYVIGDIDHRVDVRSKILGTATKVFHVRALYSRDKKAAADAFVDSFALDLQ